MTSLTGTTRQTLKGTVEPPTLAAALAGTVVQFTMLGYVWMRFTTLGACVSAGQACNFKDDPWVRQVLATLALCLGLWLYSLRTIPATGTSDPSIVDRLWSILPWLYCWHWYFSAPSPRLLLMSLLATAWGVRLTWNFYLKGGFSGGEDYRWAEIRTWPGFRTGWELFNLAFVCGFQQLVILAFAAPAATVISSAAPLNALDAVAAFMFLGLIAGEATADWQMLQFQQEKYRRIHAKEPLGPYSRGFITSGLWRYSRHPNYFCEVSLWWVFYLFSIAAGEALLNWSIFGAIFLTCLFVLPHASLDVTEALSSRKYATFADYQQTTSRFLPLPPRPSGVVLAPMRAVDALLVCWFAIGILITFFIDMEQVLIADPDEYYYTLHLSGHPWVASRWPPRACVLAIHWWGHLADKLVLARPVWFQAAIWLEVLVQAPFYAIAIFAFLRQLNWIRTPAIVYSTVLLTIMPIVLAEQYFGEHRTAKPLLVTAVYGPYVVMPILLLLRVSSPQVFPPPTQAKAEAAASAPSRRRASASPARPSSAKRKSA